MPATKESVVTFNEQGHDSARYLESLREATLRNQIKTEGVGMVVK